MNKRRCSAFYLLFSVAMVSGVVGLVAPPAHAAGPPCTKSWASAVNGSWSDGTKWSPSGAPSSSDDVCILVDGTYTVTLDVSASANTFTLGGTTGIQTVDLPGSNRSLAIGSDSSIGAQGLITMEGAGGYSNLSLQTHTLANSGTIRTFPGGADARRFINNGTLTNSGTLDLQGGATDQAFGALSLTNTNAISVAASQSVDLSNVSNDAGTITNSGSFVVKGTYTQDDGETSGNPIVIGSGATLNVTGTGDAEMAAGGNISLAGGPLAAGQSLDLPGGNTGATLSSDFTNAGLITMEGTGGYSILALNGHVLTNSGTVMTFSGGADTRRFINNGTLTNSGTLDFQGGATDQSFGALSLTNTNAISVAASQSVDFLNATNNAGTITNNGSFQVKGTYTQGGGATSGNPVVIGNGGALNVTGTGDAEIAAGGNISLVGGPLAAGQSLDLPGGNIGATLSSDFTNAGLITMEGAGGYSILALNGHVLTNSGTVMTLPGGADTRRFINNGTLTNSGTLDLQGGATDTVFGALALTNTNAISVAASQSVDFLNATNNAGTITNNGSFQVKGTYTQGGGATSGNPIVIGNGGVVSLTGSGAAAMRAGGNISLVGGPLAAGQSLDLPGGNVGATLSSDFTNAGLIKMEGAGGYSFLALNAHTLTNSGTLRTFPGGADGRRFINNGTLTNTGTLDLQGGADDTVFGQTTVNNQNVISIDAGQALLLASFTQTATGTLRLNHDATPVIGSVTTTGTATLDGCVGGTGPTLPAHSTLTGMAASSVTGTFSCTDFVTQQFNPVYSATQVQLVVPNTAIAVSPSSGSHNEGTAIVAAVSRVGASGNPAGAVHLYEGATLIDTQILDISGGASLLTSSLALGAHTLHVVYDGNGSDDATDSGHFTITFVAPPPPPMCGASGILKVSPGVTSTPSTKGGNLSFKGTLTACNNFGSFTGAKFPISAGSFTMSIKKLNPGATCGSLDTGPGAKFSTKLSFKFKGINPKTGKLATATTTTAVGLASVSEQTGPFGHTAVSLVITKIKSPFLGHSATLTLVYDETPAQISTSCASKGGLKALHFGSVLDHKILWSPVNGPSTFELSD